MMAEYIEREAVVLKVQRHLMPNVDIDGSVLVEDAERYFLKLLKEQPAADVVEVVRGTWKSAYEYAVNLGCTDEKRLEELKADKIWKFCPFCEQQVKGDHNYCSNCGAKMNGEKGGSDGAQ